MSLSLRSYVFFILLELGQYINPNIERLKLVQTLYLRELKKGRNFYLY